ncbi:hypothetical protein PPSIR1_21569 [Plesiocystis pacifica SIR-1]|uniref:WGR domain-containing protein n=1 Tax=Plesiocystis pacifica SIR-1 TaxID=391625 RepID=A6FXG1_9BACT|nr:TIGR02996 domain-containing protein [Plesiocystis pacifica]EDM81549.1 hypothetical protein PPSIR1_21569 [Plesiocystis pacifica SIR-1]
MSRLHPPLEFPLPTQHLELVDRRRGPRVVTLVLSRDELTRRYGPADGPWKTQRLLHDSPEQAYRAASAQASRLRSRGYTLGEREPRLEAAIAAKPDDPAPYHVYADWFAARGDPLGEFIQVSTALDARPDDPRLTARERRLVAANSLRLTRPHWIRGCVEDIHVTPLHWRYGFIEGVSTRETGYDQSMAVGESRQLPFRPTPRQPARFPRTWPVGYELVELLDNVRRHPMGIFVRRLYTREGCYALRHATPAPLRPEPTPEQPYPITPSPWRVTRLR